MKLLSIIIPAFNMERYLSRTLQSLLIGGNEQELLDIVVVNDGSNDQTSNIAHEFASLYPDIVRVIDKANGHYGSCINAALKNLRGVYARVLDADDSVVSENFRKFVSFLREKNIDASFALVDCFLTDSLRVSEIGDVLSKESVPIPARRVLAKAEIPRHFVFQMYAITYRTSILVENHYRQTEGILYTDTEWMAYPLTWVRCLYYWSGHPVYKYLIGRSGQSVDPRVYSRNMAQRIKMFARMVRESSNMGISDSDRYRLSFVAKSGIMAIYKKAFKCSCMAGVNRAMQEVDDMVLNMGDDVYQSLAETPLSPYIRFRLLRAWRRKHCFSKGMIWLIRALMDAEAASGMLRHLIRKAITYIW